MSLLVVDLTDYDAERLAEIERDEGVSAVTVAAQAITTWIVLSPWQRQRMVRLAAAMVAEEGR